MAQLTLVDLDANLRQKYAVPENAVFYDGLKAPFTLYGLPADQEAPLCRLPQDLFEKCTPAVQALSMHTAGGRIRFSTDAAQIHLAVTLYEKCLFPHMPLTGTSGLDVYCDDQWASSVRPYFGSDQTPKLEYVGSVDLPGEGMREVTIYLPLYNGVRELSVGLEPGAQVLPDSGYAMNNKPVLFYGSSITQGGCACRTSTCYTAMVTRWLNVDHINLGFSGNGRGEDYMAEYIASLDLSAVVMDYDHNAPDAAHLKATHEPFYRIIRQARPDLPILMMSKPDFVAGKHEAEERRAVIRETYDHAVAAGDQKVWFLDGETLLEGRERASCTVDGCHPNDLGFYRMAKKVKPILKEMLNMD